MSASGTLRLWLFCHSRWSADALGIGAEFAAPVIYLVRAGTLVEACRELVVHYQCQFGWNYDTIEADDLDEILNTHAIFTTEDWNAELRFGWANSLVGVNISGNSAALLATAFPGASVTNLAKFLDVTW